MTVLWTFHGTEPIYAIVPIYAPTGQIVCHAKQIVGWRGYNIYPTTEFQGPPPSRENQEKE